MSKAVEARSTENLSACAVLTNQQKAKIRSIVNSSQRKTGKWKKKMEKSK